MIMGSIPNTNWTLRKFRMEYRAQEGDGLWDEPWVLDALDAHELAAGFPGLPGTALLLLLLSSANNYTWHILAYGRSDKFDMLSNFQYSAQDPASPQCSWIEIVRDKTTDGWKVDDAMPDEVPERDDKVVGEAQVTLGTDEARVETRPPSPPPLPAKGLHLDQSVTVAWKGLRESIAWISRNQHAVAIPMTEAKYLPLDLRESGL
ncbi:hypothetical protein JB92DRAFT_3100206 [Gautieria morchelliformis]|nr:hypothetical protein JB92DRAFT_3100206 [Gautieria morchelliformis]